jgi:hypothetical protein
MKNTVYFQKIQSKSPNVFLWSGLIRYNAFDETQEPGLSNVVKKIKDVVGKNIKIYVSPAVDREREELYDYNAQKGCHLAIELSSEEENDIFSFYNDSGAFNGGSNEGT